MLAIAAVLTLAVLLGAGVAWGQGTGSGKAGSAPAQDAPAISPNPSAQLAYIARLYDQNERFRAESEMLRFLHDHPHHVRRADVELARAKLYYGQGEVRTSSLMLFSLIDRYAQRDLPPQTLRLLVFSLIREGRIREAGGFAEPAGLAPGAVLTLELPTPGSVDPAGAVAWSTWLPGSGFYVLGQPAKGTAALGLNLVFTGGAVVAFQQGNSSGALALLLVELALYSGGRNAVRDEAHALNARLQRRRLEAWLAAHGETALIAHAFGPAE